MGDCGCGIFLTATGGNLAKTIEYVVIRSVIVMALILWNPPGSGRLLTGIE